MTNKCHSIDQFLTSNSDKRNHVTRFDSKADIALLALEYQQILNIDWNRIEIASQNGLAWISNNISNTVGAPHSGTLSHVGIPIASASAGLILGLTKG